jgi:hypothetical protein
VNWNPFKKKLPDSVYLSIWLDKPFQGIHVSPPKGTWIKVSGLSLEAAAQVIPGRSLNWHTLPMSIRAQLEIDFKGAEMDWEKLKEWVI